MSSTAPRSIFTLGILGDIMSLEVGGTSGVPESPPPPPQEDTSSAEPIANTPEILTINNLRISFPVKLKFHSLTHQRNAAFSVKIFGVMNTSISVLVADLELFLNRLPTIGIFPNNGTFCTVSLSLSV